MVPFYGATAVRTRISPSPYGFPKGLAGLIRQGSTAPAFEERGPLSHAHNRQKEDRHVLIYAFSEGLIQTAGRTPLRLFVQLDRLWLKAGNEEEQSTLPNTSGFRNRSTNARPHRVLRNQTFNALLVLGRRQAPRTRGPVLASRAP
jgi:hypothetical protein